MDSDSFNQRMLDDLYLEMIRYFDQDVTRIQHFVKVHSLARLIAVGENMDAASLYILQAAALTHDIGIKPAEEKYGCSNGKMQEQEGPIVAQHMLKQLGFDNYVIDRICFLIGHHHTYDNIDGLDYQILVEADFLVNIFEEHYSDTELVQVYHNIFVTETGKMIFRKMYGSVDD